MGESLSEIRIKNRRKRLALLWLTGLILSVAGVALLMMGSTPDRVGPLGVTLFFLLVFSALLSLGLFLRARLVKDGSSASQLLIILIAAAITGAMAIGTIELQVGDIVLLGLFVLTFGLYWTRLR